MYKLVFLASGGGGNLKFIWKCIQNAYLENVVISYVIVDRECGATEAARRANLPFAIIDYSSQAPEELQSLLQKVKPDFIITTISKILDPKTLAMFPNQFINLHYSILPAFGACVGVKPVKLALEAGCKTIGTTVHYVTEQVDAGPIISQTSLCVDVKEEFPQLMNRVFQSGCLNLLGALQQLTQQNPVNEGEPFGDSFWEEVRTF